MSRNVDKVISLSDEKRREGKTQYYDVVFYIANIVCPNFI